MRPTSVVTLRRSAFLVCGLALAILAGQMVPLLNRMREDAGLLPYAESGNLAPGVEFATKTLGSFRSIAITTLWLRATKLQEDGKFFELNDLFRLISQLEPRFPMVWAYWAWNVAYNCSVKFPMTQPQERWRWVRLGIETLRDQGIPLNPRAPLLYRELAWIYSHKIGENMDDAHIHYKVWLAMEMQAALGEPPYLEPVKAMAAAPESEKELLTDAAVRDLAGALKKAGVDPFSQPLLVANRGPELPPKARAILELPDHAEAAARLEAFLRAAYLRKRERLEPAKLLGLMERFGPIDWRLPEAMALYWSAESVRLYGDDVLNSANADRMLFHDLVRLYRRGRLFFEPPTPEEGPAWVGAPNFAFLERIIKLHTEIADRHKSADWRPPTEEGFLNFLREAIVSLYLHNDLKRANDYLKMLIERGGEPKMNLDTFVVRRLKSLMTGVTYEQATNLIRGYFHRGIFWASLGDSDQGAGNDGLAILLYKKYESEHQSERFRLPPQRQLWMDALRQATLTFRASQMARLRELYPRQVGQIEEERKRLREKRKKPEEERTDGEKDKEKSKEKSPPAKAPAQP